MPIHKDTRCNANYWAPPQVPILLTTATRPGFGEAQQVAASIILWY